MPQKLGIHNDEINFIASKPFFIPTAYTFDFGSRSSLKQTLNLHQFQIIDLLDWLLYQRHLFRLQLVYLTGVEQIEIKYYYTFKLYWLALAAHRKSGTDVLVFGRKAKKS